MCIFLFITVYGQSYIYRENDIAMMWGDIVRQVIGRSEDGRGTF